MATFGPPLVTTSGLADNAVTKVKMADDAVASAEIEADSIVNSDVNSAAAIAYSKLNLALGIVNADINAAAAIVDTKLAQIATASKVSGAALTSLASIPAGAGIIPTANLPSGTPSRVFIRAANIELLSGGSRVQSGPNSHSAAIRAADAATTTIGWAARVLDGYTSISSIKILYYPAVGGNDVFTSGNIVNLLPVSGAAATNDADAADEAITVGATAARLYEYTLVAARYSSIASVAGGDWLSGRIQFGRGDAGDTNTGNFDILGILIQFA